jgi:hypothetical protein
MNDSISFFSAKQWNEVQSILQNLPLDTPAFELSITKRSEQEFTVQFKNLNHTIDKSKLSKINPVGLHDLFW